MDDNDSESGRDCDGLVTSIQMKVPHDYGKEGEKRGDNEKSEGSLAPCTAQTEHDGRNNGSVR
jgi:hypothetical protein